MTRSGSRFAGFSSGVPCVRACSRSASIGGLGRRLLDPVADRPFELRGARLGEPVRRVQLQRLAVLEQRPVELILRLELARAADVLARGALHRPLERDLVLRVVGVLLHGLREVRRPPRPSRRPGPPPGRCGTRGPAAQPDTSAATRTNRNQPVLQHRHSIQRGRPLSGEGRWTDLPRRTSLEADRRAPAPVDVLHHHRLDADADEPIPPVDDLPFAAVVRSSGSRSSRRPSAARLLDDPDELQRNRRRRRRPGRTGGGPGCRHRPASPPVRRRAAAAFG